MPSVDLNTAFTLWPRRHEAADREAGTLGRPAFHPVRHGLLQVLQWGDTDGFTASLTRGHRARVRAASREMMDRFLRAGVGGRLSRLMDSLTPDALDRLLRAPETARRLLHGDGLDLAFFFDAALAEHYRQGRPTGIDEAVWSALGDRWFPRGTGGRTPLASGDARAWRADRVYAAPCLSNGVSVDTASPAARRPVPRVRLGRYQPFDDVGLRRLVADLESATRGVLRACPAAHRLFTRFVAVIVARRDDDNRGSFANFSVANQPGRITLVNAHAPHVDVPELADRLVHETIHSFLYIVEATHTFTPDRSVIDEVRIRSPWTGNILGLHSFLHACLVWFGLWKFWEAALAAGAFPRDRAYTLLRRAWRGFRDPELPALVASLKRYISPDAQALFPRLVTDIRGGVYG